MNEIKRLFSTISQSRLFRRGEPIGYTLPNAFYLRQCAYLALSALFLLWMSRDGRLDAWFSAPWFDAHSLNFPLQENRWLELLNHRAGKIVVITLGVCVLLRGLYTANRRLLTVLLLMVCGALVISYLKAHSAHSCPWDLVQYGGKAQEFLLLGTPPANAGPGRCFPGGHSSTGFVLMAWFFWFYPTRPRLAHGCWWLGIAAGLLLGYGQLMRGAHFMSHNLWAGWWVWAVQLLIFWLLTCRQSTRQNFSS